MRIARAGSGILGSDDDPFPPQNFFEQPRRKKGQKLRRSLPGRVGEPGVSFPTSSSSSPFEKHHERRNSGRRVRSGETPGRTYVTSRCAEETDGNILRLSAPFPEILFSSYHTPTTIEDSAGDDDDDDNLTGL